MSSKETTGPAAAPPPPAPVDRIRVGSVTATKENDRFRRAAKVSAIVHGVLFIGAILSQLIFPGTPVVYTPSVKVDLIGLPDLKKTDLSQATNAALEQMKKKLSAVDEAIKKERVEEARRPKKPVEVTPPEPNAMTMKPKEQPAANKNDRRKQLSSAIERMRALQAMEDSVQETKAPAKGNQLSRGSQMTGTIATDVNVYVDDMVTRIRSNWDLPLWLAKSRFSAKVILFIGSSGQVARIQFVQPSGNEQFDQYVRNAINRSAPFTAPPSDIESDGIMLGFPL